MSNPLLDKFNEIYNAPKQAPQPSPQQLRRFEMSYDDQVLIKKLEWLLDRMKTGEASYLRYDIADNYRRMIPIPIPLHINSDTGDLSNKPYVSYDEGQMITIQIFNRYEQSTTRQI